MAALLIARAELLLTLCSSSAGSRGPAASSLTNVPEIRIMIPDTAGSGWCMASREAKILLSCGFRWYQSRGVRSSSSHTHAALPESSSPAKHLPMNNKSHSSQCIKGLTMAAAREIYIFCAGEAYTSPPVPLEKQCGLLVTRSRPKTSA